MGNIENMRNNFENEKIKKQEFKFPIGYESFHKKQLFNFQLNRPYSFGYARFEDMKEAGQKIKSFSDWKREMLNRLKKLFLKIG